MKPQMTFKSKKEKTLTFLKNSDYMSIKYQILHLQGETPFNQNLYKPLCLCFSPAPSFVAALFWFSFRRFLY